MTERNKLSNHLPLKELGISIVVSEERLDSKLLYAIERKSIIADKSATMNELAEFVDRIVEAGGKTNEL